MDNGNLNASHLAWCGLVALRNARDDGEVSLPAQENLFIIRWLAAALTQRRFSRDVTRTLRGPSGKRKIPYAKPVFCTDHFPLSVINGIYPAPA